MSVIKTNTAYRGALDHFEPELEMDAAEQRRLRGALEQIDYTAFAANKTVLEHTPGAVDLGAMQRLAVAAASARAQWVAAALALADAGHGPTREEIEALSLRRVAFDELREAYEGMRRMIERSYISYKSGS